MGPFGRTGRRVEKWRAEASGSFRKQVDRLITGPPGSGLSTVSTGVNQFRGSVAGDTVPLFYRLGIGSWKDPAEFWASSARAAAGFAPAGVVVAEPDDREGLGCVGARDGAAWGIAAVAAVAEAGGSGNHRDLLDADAQGGGDGGVGGFVQGYDPEVVAGGGVRHAGRGDGRSAVSGAGSSGEHADGV